MTATSDKEWRQVVGESQEQRFADGPVEGPPSVLHIMKHWLRHGGNPRLWLDVWSRAKNVAAHERAHHELAVLLEMFYVGGCYDQLSMASLGCFEVTARRVQSIVDAYAGDPSRPSWANARVFSGVGTWWPRSCAITWPGERRRRPRWSAPGSAPALGDFCAGGGGRRGAAGRRSRRRGPKTKRKSGRAGGAPPAAE